MPPPTFEPDRLYAPADSEMRMNRESQNFGQLEVRRPRPALGEARRASAISRLRPQRLARRDFGGRRIVRRRGGVGCKSRFRQRPASSRQWRTRNPIRRSRATPWAGFVGPKMRRCGTRRRSTSCCFWHIVPIPMARLGRRRKVSRIGLAFRAVAHNWRSNCSMSTDGSRRSRAGADPRSDGRNRRPNRSARAAATARRRGSIFARPAGGLAIWCNAWGAHLMRPPAHLMRGGAHLMRP